MKQKCLGSYQEGKEKTDVVGIAEEGLGLTRFVDGNGWLLLPCSLVDISAMRKTLVGYREAM